MKKREKKEKKPVIVVKAQAQNKKQRKSILGIRSKLILTSLVPVLFIVLLGSFSYRKAADAIVSNYKISTHNTITKAGEYYTLLFENLDNTNCTFYNQSDLVEYYSGSLKKDATKEVTAYKSLKNRVDKEKISNGRIAAISIAGNYGTSISTAGKIGTEYFSQLGDSEVMEYINASPTKSVWLGYHPSFDELMGMTDADYAISNCRTVKNANMKNVAIVVTDYQRDKLIVPIESMDFSARAYCALVTTDGKEITTDELTGRNTFCDKDFYQEMVTGTETDVLKTVTIEGEEFLYIFYKIGNTGSSICYIIPQSEIMQQANEIKQFTIIMVVAASIFAILLSVLMAAGIAKALHMIEVVTRKAAAGDLSGIINSKRKDELGRLASHTSGMVGEIKGLISHVSEVTDHVFKTSDSVAEGSVEMLNAAKHISKTMEAIESGINEEAASAQDCRNRMSELSDIIGVVSQNTERINQSATETREILKTGMETMDDLSRNVKSTTRITNSVIESMEELNKESGQIGSFTDTINEIAEQTNLLALNASIEAARAGEAGKGFAVVAMEIRKLAEESKTASGQIQEIIGKIQAKMQGTTKTAGEAGEVVDSQDKALLVAVKVFTKISQQMDDLAGNIRIITDKVSDMDISKESTLEAIENISVVLEETAAASTDILDAVSKQEKTAEKFEEEVAKLQQNSGKLRNSIQIFKI